MARSNLRRGRQGLTLVEILFCIIIVASLAAIAVSVSRRVKWGGSLPSEISQLRKLGQAANLYREQNDGWPSNTTTLVNAGLLSKETCYSSRDKYEIGWANRYLAGNAQQASSYANKLAPFPNTYLSVFDTQFPGNRLDKILAEQKGIGLFVSLVESSNMFQNDSPTGPFAGTYRRVLLDGSVQKRAHITMKGPGPDGKTVTMMADVTWFFDPDDRWKRDFLLTD